MIQFLFKRLLTACYCSAKRIINKKKKDRIIPFTLHLFLTPFSFIASGFLLLFLDYINFKYTSVHQVFIGVAVILLGVGYGFQKVTKRALFKWNIEKNHKKLNKNEHWNKCILAFVFFWGGFVFFCYFVTQYFKNYYYR